MSCEHFESLIALDMSGDLSASETRQVRAHLGECPSCRALAEDLSADLQWLQEAHREPVDRAALDQVRTSVMRQLEREQERRNRPFGGLFAAGWRWQWVAVSAALAVLLSGVVWWARPSGHSRNLVTVNAPDGAPQRYAREASGAASRPTDARSASSPAVTPSKATVPSKAAAVSEPNPANRRVDATAAGGKNKRPPTPARSLRQSPPPQAVAHLAHATPPEPRARARVSVPYRSGQQAELVTTILPPSEPQQAPSEAVMLKLPTRNPDIIVYWLMDDAGPAVKTHPADTENQGD